MKITQTSYFMDDVKHYTQLAQDTMYTTARDATKANIYRLEKLRGKAYIKALAGKCNQKLKVRFYEV